MKFGNVVLLCKHWYESRDHNDLDTFWMDMAHAIDADGWMCFSKKDVSRWCIHRLDECDGFCMSVECGESRSE